MESKSGRGWVELGSGAGGGGSASVIGVAIVEVRVRVTNWGRRRRRDSTRERKGVMNGEDDGGLKTKLPTLARGLRNENRTR